MSRDPLTFFLNEKTATESAVDTAQDIEQKPFTRDPDPQSIDPGERAMAGILAVGGSTVGGVASFLGNVALRNAMMKGDKESPFATIIRQTQASDLKRLGDLNYGAKDPKARLLGLFDVKARIPGIPEAVLKETDEAFARFAENPEYKHTWKHPLGEKRINVLGTVSKITDTVDSFIDKHNLAQKGVTTNLKQGPLNWMLGPRYELATKRVYLPDVSKELALHELGHAADYTKGRIGKVRANLEPLLRRSAQIALPTALIAGDRIKELLPGTIDDKAIEFMQRHAPEIAGATIAATTLYPEAKASVLALQHIKETEGRAAALKSLKRLGAGWGTYVLGAIPTIVGLSLARKYMREAREEKGETEDLIAQKLQDLEKTSGAISDLARSMNPVDLIGQAARGIRSAGRDAAFLGKQIAQQSKDMINNREVLHRVTQAAKEVGTDPTFIQGAMISAVPATLAGLYLYGTESGKEVRKRMDPADVRRTQSGSDEGLALVHSRTNDEWRERHPLRFAGLVAAGAALSGGVLAKMYSDLARVL